MRDRWIAVIALATTLCGPALAASMDDLNLPDRKPGQWKMTIQPTGMPKPIVTEICLDAATDKALMKAGMSMSQCAEMTVGHDGNDTIIDATCTIGGMTLKSHSVISGDFQSAYTVHIVSDRIAGTSPMPKHSEMTQAATWEGDCKGLKPGELLMPNGMKMDMTKMLGGG